ncbi:hypothetical protein MSG28_015403 [Choristoneura fumiferana]|uniref:Uncharacterized protein n=1 Tax=Choristoneura fumiferana TaxID=7141 RepID=A0ACC0KA80_CHOFU|nr:hypothetical protein MSG28_015403 [Choristoneura fumiferana]
MYQTINAVKDSARRPPTTLVHDDTKFKIDVALFAAIKENGDRHQPSKSFKPKPTLSKSCRYRRVLLHFLYFGWDYQGLAVQEDTSETIEHHLFLALRKSCLIEKRETSQYHRCGRTDKGVSSFGQVISISLRSTQNPEDSDLSKEIPYCKILNRLLPKDIRAVAWMPIPDDKPEYSARFDCKKRQYKYYFPRGSLDVAAMRAACSHLIGSHDFRHLCKMDVGNGVTQFVREIISAEVLPVDGDGESPYKMYYLLIEGNAFLWHQIRCIMGVLILIGQGKESPDIVKELLDIEKYPRKPQYSMALDVPLNLFHCSYGLEDTQRWIYDKEELRTVITQLQGAWTLYNIKSTMIQDSLRQLEKEYENLSRSEMKVVNADELETDTSLEERIEFYKRKRKTVTEDINV